MKKTNAYSYKLAIVATSMVMVYFASGIASIAQATELVKAEPVAQELLMQEAKANLALSFTTLTITSEKNDATAMIAKQAKKTDKNQPQTLTKVTLLGE